MDRSGEDDVFARGLPVFREFLSGFKRHFDDIEMKPEAMADALRGTEVRPGTLQENLRANMFPDIIESVIVRAYGVFMW